MLYFSTTMSENVNIKPSWDLILLVEIPLVEIQLSAPRKVNLRCLHCLRSESVNMSKNIARPNRFYNQVLMIAFLK